MIIGVLSDTHNNLKNLALALDLFRARGVDTLIHCGDLTGVEVARKLEGFHVICAFGNGDIESGEIRSVLLEQDPLNYAGMVYTGRIGASQASPDGVRIAVTHGHLPGKVEELVHSGNYDYVFKGHSHQHVDQTFRYTRLINPGALGGLHREPRHVCLLNLDSGKAEFLQIVD